MHKHVQLDFSIGLHFVNVSKSIKYAKTRLNFSMGFAFLLLICNFSWMGNTCTNLLAFFCFSFHKYIHESIENDDQ